MYVHVNSIMNLISYFRSNLRVLMSITTISRNRPTLLFQMKLLQRVLFSWKYVHLFMPWYIQQEARKKQHCARGGTNKWRQTPLAVIKQVLEKRSIAEAMHAYINRARLTVCEVGVFSREISQLSEIRPPPSLRNHLSSSPMSVFSRYYSS